jgi:hypothetical protein
VLSALEVYAFALLASAQARQHLRHQHCCITQGDRDRIIEVCPFRCALQLRPQPGEDPYPSVVDTLVALTGGELVNGTEEDFVPIE